MHIRSYLKRDRARRVRNPLDWITDAIVWVAVLSTVNAGAMWLAHIYEQIKHW